jgi:HPt (histidine-containing phosphotransfer) domain-containing protein
MLPPLKIALVNQQPIALKNAAHDAKSASSSIAAPRLTTLLKHLEIEAPRENWESLYETFEEVKLEFDLIVQFSGSR